MLPRWAVGRRAGAGSRAAVVRLAAAVVVTHMTMVPSDVQCRAGFSRTPDAGMWRPQDHTRHDCRRSGARADLRQAGRHRSRVCPPDVDKPDGRVERSRRCTWFAPSLSPDKAAARRTAALIKPKCSRVISVEPAGFEDWLVDPDLALGCRPPPPRRAEKWLPGPDSNQRPSG